MVARYLLWQQLTSGDSDTRFEGGFGAYEAPEPWGPWASPNGREAWMVFSGSDIFCVRRVIFSAGRR